MKDIGLYIHVPFCKSRCPYCDFYTMRADEETKAAYVEAVKRSLREWAAKEDFCASTVYFGGGTPSVLTGEQVAEILTVVKELYHVPAAAEITVECNPSSDLEHFIPVVASAGVNRVSLGMQSAVDAERRQLGRLSGTARVEECLDICRSAGIDNLSLDIMLGVPDQTMESLQSTLDFCVDTGVPHISSYMLKLEEGTNYWKRQDRLNLADEDTVSAFYLEVGRRLAEAGFSHYEISNYAKPGYESRHNTKYWQCKEYLGIGPAAHSFLDGKRFYYERDLSSFLNGTEPVFDCTGGDFSERLMLALRLSEGFSEELPERIRQKLTRPYLAPYVTYDGTTLKLTEQGFLVSNAIIGLLLDD